MAKERDLFDKVNQGVTLFNHARKLWETGKNWYEERTERELFFITIEENDRIYDDVLMWMATQMPPQDLKNMIAKSSHSSRDEMVVKFFHNAEVQVRTDVGGHDVFVEISSKRGGPKKDEDDDPLEAAYGTFNTFAPKNIVFSTDSVEGRNAVQNLLRQLVQSETARAPRFMMSTKYGHWQDVWTSRNRPLDTVILDSDDRERIISDLSRFLEQEEQYTQIGVPWHRGYLFHGPPGTGKTSFASALAGHFRLDTYYLPLSTVPDDNKLMESMRQVDGNGVVILEDVDIVHGTHDRDAKGDDKGVTLQGLLNTLDGLITPHGMILVMTTNDLNILDPALIRPGRADVQLEIGYLTDDQLRRMCKRFVGREYVLPEIKKDIAPAEVTDIFKRNLNSKNLVEEELIALITE